jgi:hypothetical protein
MGGLGLDWSSSHTGMKNLEVCSSGNSVSIVVFRLKQWNILQRSFLNLLALEFYI